MLAVHSKYVVEIALFNILAVHSKYMVERARYEIKYLISSHHDTTAQQLRVIFYFCLPWISEEVHPLAPSDGGGDRSLGTIKFLGGYLISGAKF